MNSAAVSNNCYPSDVHSLSDFSWGGSKVQNKVSITQIRAYSLGTSPNIYFSNAYLGTSVNPGGSGNMAYVWSPSSIAQMNWGNPGYFVMECVTATPHNFNSGQWLTWSNNYLTESSGGNYVGPSSQATVNVTGGGASGGSLSAGNYYVSYTYVDVNGMESSAGSYGHNSESAQFTVASGNKPRVTFNDSSTKPSYAVSRNIYLTAAGGTAGSEVLYASAVPIASTTYDLTAVNTGTVTIPVIPHTLQQTNGNGSPIPFSFYESPPSGAVNQCLFVTGASTFIWFGNGGASTVGSLPTNNVAVTYNVPASSPLYATVSTPDGATLPYEVCAQSASNVPGCAAHINVPLPATDACVTQIANSVLSYLAPGHRCYVEINNEPWNTGSPQDQSFNYAIANVSGGAVAANSTTAGMVLRASQVHKIFAGVFGAAGRASDIRRVFSSQPVVGGANGIISTVNTWNAANPSNPIQIDAIMIAPYLNMINDSWPDPTAQATVSSSGSTGNLTAGTYYAAYTYIDSLTGYESAIGKSESTQFTITSGQIPTITFNDTMPAYAASRNVYLTTNGGAAGSEVRYATGVTGSTYACSAANTGSAAAPTNNRTPSYHWAAASIAASNSESIANTSVNPGNPYAANPWTYDSWSDFLRHHAKYNAGSNGLNGSNGLLAQQVAYLKNNYTLVPGQPAPVVAAYEADYFTLVSVPVQNNPPSSPSLLGQLLHDISYHPSMYYVELAFLQSLQTGGLALADMQTIAGPRAANGTLQTYAMWSGQKSGRGDNSDGKGTNLLWLNTGQAEDLNNVSPKLQAWQDWAGAGNVAPAGGLLAPFSHAPMIRSAATHGWHGLVMTRMNLLPASPRRRTKALVSRDVAYQEDLLIGARMGPGTDGPGRPLTHAFLAQETLNVVF